MVEKVKSLNVTLNGEPAGLLRKAAQFEFEYAADAKTAVSLVMPVGREVIKSNILHPVFEMNLPEGYLRQRIIERFRKYANVDEMFFLALQGDQSIGFLGFETPDLSRERVTGISVGDLVNAKDPGLFESLVERYLGQTTIAGVQPKILVPEPTVGDKSAFTLPELIVKTNGPEFPGLAVNEFICMSIARKAGLRVPEFYLSADERLFIMRRFDITENGQRLGMEDICALTGRTADKKYRSSYEQVAKAVSVFSETPSRDLAEYFRSLCITVLVGNGDAHLKNFAFLYADPGKGKGWLSPAYDIVNTSLYIEGDPLALKMLQTQDYPNRSGMIRFGNEYCSLTQKEAKTIIDECIEAANSILKDERERCEALVFVDRTLLGELERGVQRLMEPEEKSKVWIGEVRKPKRVR